MDMADVPESAVHEDDAAESGAASPGGCVRPVEATGAAGSVPGLITVHFKPELVATTSATIGTAAAVVVLVILSVYLADTFDYSTVAMTVIICLVLWHVWFYIESRADAMRIAEVLNIENMDAALPATLNSLRCFHATTALEMLLRSLHARGLRGLTVHAAPEAAPAPLCPLALPFEPRRLDLCGAAAMRAKGDAEAILASRVGAGGLLMRSVRMVGGWTLVVGYGFVLIIIAFLMTKSAGIYLLGLMAAYGLSVAAPLVLAFFAPFGFGRQWFVVPGGLALRRASWLRRGWRLHLFDRRESVAILCRLRRRRWILAMADGRQSASVVGMCEELEFALRAWLSPLDPPPAERLSDLQ